MKTGCICQDGTRSASPLQRARRIVAWIIPSATLVLMPKCPLCIAAYVALLGGASITAACASNLRMALLVFSTATLVFLALKRLARKRIPNQPGGLRDSSRGYHPR